MAEMEESPYCASLDVITRGRYLQKVSKYAGRDPYLLKKTDFSTDLKDLPAKSTRGAYFTVFTARSCLAISLNVTSTKQRKKN